MSFHVHWLAVPALVATAGDVHAARYLTVEQAQTSIFPGESMHRVEITLTREQCAAIAKASGVPVKAPVLKVWRSPMGATFFVDDVIGKHEFITYAVGLSPDGSIRRVEILEYRENYGDEIRRETWTRQFAGRRHGAPLRLVEDIKNISGATLSCRHVTDGIRRILATHALLFGK